jgi:hypothetical protein
MGTSYSEPPENISEDQLIKTDIRYKFNALIDIINSCENLASIDSIDKRKKKIVVRLKGPITFVIISIYRDTQNYTIIHPELYKGGDGVEYKKFCEILENKSKYTKVFGVTTEYKNPYLFSKNRSESTNTNISGKSNTKPSILSTKEKETDADIKKEIDADKETDVPVDECTKIENSNHKSDDHKHKHKHHVPQYDQCSTQNTHNTHNTHDTHNIQNYSNDIHNRSSDSHNYSSDIHNHSNNTHTNNSHDNYVSYSHDSGTHHSSFDFSSSFDHHGHH